MRKVVNQNRVRTWGAAGGAVCFVAGILSALMGSLLTASEWIVGGPVHPWIHAAGTALLILTIPLILFAGFCLDWAEKGQDKPLDDPKQTQRGAVALAQIAIIAIITGVALLAPAAFHGQQTINANTQSEQQQLREPTDRDSKDAATPNHTPLRLIGTAQRPAVQDDSKALPEDASSTPPSRWQYGGFVDLGYLLDFNHPVNHLFRSRGTAFRVDNLFVNMAAFYARKKATDESRWGVELTAHAGKDSEFFGFSATAPNIGGYKFLRQLGPTNVSYLAPTGKGLTLQAGIFTSLIGYDSLYAKDNVNYTRPWGADFTPYFMMGANASYPFNERVTGTFVVVNGYWHLAKANNVPSSGAQIAYKVNPRVTVKGTVLLGPHQSNTSFKFWRFLTDTIVERKTDRVTLALEYIYSQERADAPGSPRALMMSSQLPVRWSLNKRWALAVRPEFFWDRDGRWTLSRQTVTAFTTTLEYRLPYRWTNAIFRLEHRFDDSRGPDGGFFRGGEVQPGVVGLTPGQHLLIFATIFTFDR